MSRLEEMRHPRVRRRAAPVADEAGVFVFTDFTAGRGVQGDRLFVGQGHRGQVGFRGGEQYVRISAKHFDGQFL